jgi:copper chaperone CopZ
VAGHHQIRLRATLRDYSESFQSALRDALHYEAWKEAQVEERRRGSSGWQTPSRASIASTPLRLRLILPLGGLDRDARGVHAVERALDEVPGVIRAYANAATEMAYVEYDPSQIGLDELKAAIESVGCRLVPAEEPQ